MEKKDIQTSDPVNHPAHYMKGNVECIDAIESAVVNLTGVEAFLTGQVIKYSYRWKDKGGAEDLRKAGWYLNRLINFVENPAEEHVEEPEEITVNPCPDCGCNDIGLLHFSNDSTECSVMCERCSYIANGKRSGRCGQAVECKERKNPCGMEIMADGCGLVSSCPPPHPSGRDGKENGNP